MDNENVIPVIFHPDFYKDLYQLIKQVGIQKAEQQLLDMKHHPTFAKVAVKRVIKTKGW